MAKKKRTKTMQNLINNSIQITGGTVIVYPQFDEMSYADFSDICLQHNNEYSINQEIMAFVYQEQLYVTAYTLERFRILRHNGFKPSPFWVPLANGEYPQAEQKRWKNIKSIIK